MRMAAGRIGTPGRHAPAATTNPTWTIAALALITLGAATLRLHDLVAPSLWFDELASVALARPPLAVLWSDWMVREPNPPLYYAILHVWMRAFGESEFAVRLPSALAGTLVPVLVFAVARELGRLSDRVGGQSVGRDETWDGRSTWIALLAAVLTAISMRQVASSQEARAYIFAEAAALVAIVGLLRLLGRPAGEAGLRPGRGEIADAALYVAGCTAALYFHTTMVVLPLIANIAFLAIWATRTPLSGRLAIVWLTANAVCLVAWLWWISITLKQLGSAPPDIAWMRRLAPGEAVATVLGTIFPRPTESLPRALGALGICLALVGLVRLPRPQAVVLLLFAAGVPLVLYILSFVTPVLTRRTMLWVQFAPTILIAAGAVGVANVALRGTLVAAIVLVAASGLGDTQASRVHEPWREVVGTLARTLGPDDTVIVPDAALGLAVRYYCERAACRFTLAQTTSQTTRWSVGLAKTTVLDAAAIRALLQRSGIVTGVTYTFVTLEPGFPPEATRIPGWAGPPLPTYMEVSRWGLSASPRP